MQNGVFLLFPGKFALCEGKQWRKVELVGLEPKRGRGPIATHVAAVNSFSFVPRTDRTYGRFGVTVGCALFGLWKSPPSIFNGATGGLDATGSGVVGVAAFSRS
ncbi:MAG: hypothetical protein QOJ64_2149 [Acidobacteriota bacterium]|nr:hypothetical protein [Acidobacteriota bacterium]